MIRLTRALSAWGGPEFYDALKQEIEQLNADQLFLQQGLSASSIALDDKLEAMILSAAEKDGFIHAKAGIFYAGIIAGCSCADDPTPADENSEYCEVRLIIDMTTAETAVTLLN